MAILFSPDPTYEDLRDFMDEGERLLVQQGGTESANMLWDSEVLWRNIPDPTEAELEQAMGPLDWDHVQRGENREGILNFYRRKWKKDRKAAAIEAQKSGAQKGSDVQPDPQPPKPAGIRVPGGLRGQTAQEKYVDELRRFMPQPLRAEYEKARGIRRDMLWDANERAFKEAEKREQQRLAAERELTEKILDTLQRVREDPGKAHLLPPDDVSMADLREWYEEMSKPVRTIPFPTDSGGPTLGETLLRNAAYMGVELDNFERERIQQKQVAAKSPEVAQVANLPKGKFRPWAEIRSHPGWYFLGLLFSALPLGFATIWPILTHETVPEWLAAHGWPHLTTLVIGWLAGLCVIALIIVARSSMRAYAPVTSLRDATPTAPLDSISLNEVRSEWSKLTDAQKALLKRILVNDGLSWNQIGDSYWKELPIYADWQLSDYLLERSTLLEHKSKGNADLRRYIESRKTRKIDILLGVRTWKVKKGFKSALEHVIREDDQAARS